MIELLARLRKKAVIGYVGGSDLSKQLEQLGPNCVTDFDFAFSENGLTAYRLGEQLPSQVCISQSGLTDIKSFIGFLGEERYKKLANFILHYIANLDIPKKRYSHKLN